MRQKKILTLVFPVMLIVLQGCGLSAEWTADATPAPVSIMVVDPTPTPDPAPTPTEYEQPEAEIAQEAVMDEEEAEQTYAFTVSAAGDCTLGNYVGQDYAWSFRETWDKEQTPSYFFENVLDIFQEDSLTIVNLEGPLTTAQTGKIDKTYCISGDPQYAAALQNGSVEAVSMANNHSMDYYEDGLYETQAALANAGIEYAYNSTVCLYEKDGIKVGMVSVDYISAGMGIEKYIQNGIESLKQQQADLILVCCHWGIEREYIPQDYQIDIGHKAIDWGADLVIGHHPHVLQGIEEYQGKYIIYSLGNFCFGANRNPVDKDCMIFQQTFYFTEGVREDVTDSRIIPCSISSVTNRNDYRPTPLQGEDARRIIDRVNLYSAGFGTMIMEDGRIAK